MRVITGIIVGVVLIACSAAANDAGAKTNYEMLVQRVRSGDRTVDFAELRQAAADAGVESDTDARDKLLSAARKQDFKKMAQAADAVLKSNYTDLDAHYFARIAAAKLGKPEQAEFHHWAEMELLKSLRKTGDGKTPKTAIHVISVDEEYFILRVMDQRLKEQALGTCDGSPCDVMTTFDPESKEEHTWYFNVEIPFKRMAKALGQDKKSDKK